ncbi:MAG: carboxypeptidase-like regulatory domain-containing protein, partial [Bacteroidota bacterium]|nr:carboxypeptidase-like regulatory domain-containing protein [Bacteroidota bacterium]
MKYLLIVSFCFVAFFATAQQGGIQGVVIDDTGMPIPGVTVLIKGSNQGTLTDFDGNYFLDSVDPEDVIIFSFLGFADQEFTIGNRKSLDVLLKKELQQLDEVVVIGYGEVKKSDVTGAISSVDVDGIEETGANNITQVLEGRSSGVQVRNNIGIPGAETDIIIRGRSSISTNSAPLYVVDGVLIDAAVPTSFFATPVNPLQTISSEDIESIQVLKDASATAIYGSRGANGVILITTKGGKSGNTRIFFNTSTASTSILRKVDVLSPEEYAVANNENYQQFLDAGLNVSDFRRFPTDDNGNIQSDSLQYYNWQDIMLRNAVRQSYRLGVSGGQDNNTFYVAGGLNSTDGILQS